MYVLLDGRVTTVLFLSVHKDAGTMEIALYQTPAPAKEDGQGTIVLPHYVRRNVTTAERVLRQIHASVYSGKILGVMVE